MAYLLNRVGRRLRAWMARTADEPYPPLPGPDQLENLKWYSNTTIGLLRAQTAHELLQLKRGDAVMSEDELQAELASATEDMVVAMSEEELADLMAKRITRRS